MHTNFIAYVHCVLVLRPATSQLCDGRTLPSATVHVNDFLSDRHVTWEFLGVCWLPHAKTNQQTLVLCNGVQGAQS